MYLFSYWFSFSYVDFLSRIRVRARWICNVAVQNKMVSCLVLSSCNLFVWIKEKKGRLDEASILDPYSSKPRGYTLEIWIDASSFVTRGVQWWNPNPSTQWSFYHSKEFQYDINKMFTDSEFLQGWVSSNSREKPKYTQKIRRKCSFKVTCHSWKQDEKYALPGGGIVGKISPGRTDWRESHKKNCFTKSGRKYLRRISRCILSRPYKYCVLSKRASWYQVSSIHYIS